MIGYLLPIAIGIAVGTLWRRYALRVRIERREQTAKPAARLYTVVTSDRERFTIEAPNPKAAGATIAARGYQVIAVRER